MFRNCFIVDYEKLDLNILKDFTSYKQRDIITIPEHSSSHLHPFTMIAKNESRSWLIDSCRKTWHSIQWWKRYFQNTQFSHLQMFDLTWKFLLFLMTFVYSCVNFLSETSFPFIFSFPTLYAIQLFCISIRVFRQVVNCVCCEISVLNVLIPEGDKTMIILDFSFFLLLKLSNWWNW